MHCEMFSFYRRCPPPEEKAEMEKPYKHTETKVDNSTMAVFCQAIDRKGLSPDKGGLRET